MAYKRSIYGPASMRNLYYRLRKFREILDQELIDIIHLPFVKADLIQAVRDQLYAGLDGFGEEIKPPYAKSTIKNKERKSRKGDYQPTNRVTLKDTGAFYASFDVSTEGDGISIYATDSKADALYETYGGQATLMRINREAFSEILRDKIRPLLQEAMSYYLLGKKQ